MQLLPLAQCDSLPSAWDMLRFLCFTNVRNATGAPLRLLSSLYAHSWASRTLQLILDSATGSTQDQGFGVLWSLRIVVVENLLLLKKKIKRPISQLLI